MWDSVLGRSRAGLTAYARPPKLAGMTDALHEVLPAVARRLPRASLGEWPTPIEPLGTAAHGIAVDGGRREGLFVKREDLSSPVYGGNKVRCLEPVFAELLDRGVQHAWATGAYGSNQAVAIALHAARVGLTTGAVLFPQPSTAAARANLRALVSSGSDVRLMRTILSFPYAMSERWLASRRSAGLEATIPPGAAVPLGALGHLAAALEVALDVDAGRVPPFKHVVLPIGSTCTTAGLLAGFAVAAAAGIGFGGDRPPPHVHAVRVTPWPVTAHFRVVGLALGAARLLTARGGPDVADRAALSRRLSVSGAYLGRGYGHPTPAGLEAQRVFDSSGAPHVDTTYASKAAAYVVARSGQLDGPVLFWSTKSSAPLPPTDADRLERLPRHGLRWLQRRHRHDIKAVTDS